jgi:hypothetical protein
MHNSFSLLLGFPFLMKSHVLWSSYLLDRPLLFDQSNNIRYFVYISDIPFVHVHDLERGT